jgi:hypothetical protein
MKVYMNRAWCTCWWVACERTFGWRVAHNDWGPGGCVVETEDDGRPETTVLMKDKDGDKILIITDANRNNVIDGWGRVAEPSPFPLEPRFASHFHN